MSDDEAGRDGSGGDRRRWPPEVREALRALEEAQGLPAGEIADSLADGSVAALAAAAAHSRELVREAIRKAERWDGQAAEAVPELMDQLRAIAAAVDAYEAALARWAAEVDRLEARTERMSAAVEQLGTAIVRHVRQGPRLSPFTPEVLSVLSDPHTQAGVHAIWAPREWKRPAGGTPFYEDKNKVMVYVRDVADVGALLLALDEQKAIAFIICLGKWWAEGGDQPGHGGVRLHVDDVLSFKGTRKHHGGGYRREQREAVKEDLLALRHFWVRSHQRVPELTPRGKRRLVDVDVDDPLVEVSVESVQDLWGERTPYAFRFRPGPWARFYIGGPQHWTTPVLRTIMRYHPDRDRFKMRLGIYLAFQWRIRNHQGNWDQPWKLGTLLEGAKLDAPKRNQERFFRRVFAALEELRADGVLAVCEALDAPAGPAWCPPADAPPRVWVPELLRTRWRLLPAQTVRDRLPPPSARPLAPPPAAP